MIYLVCVLEPSLCLHYSTFPLTETFQNLKQKTRNYISFYAKIVLIPCQIILKSEDKVLKSQVPAVISIAHQILISCKLAHLKWTIEMNNLSQVLSNEYFRQEKSRIEGYINQYFFFEKQIANLFIFFSFQCQRENCATYLCYMLQIIPSAISKYAIFSAEINFPVRLQFIQQIRLAQI